MSGHQPVKDARVSPGLTRYRADLISRLASRNIALARTIAGTQPFPVVANDHRSTSHPVTRGPGRRVLPDSRDMSSAASRRSLTGQRRSNVRGSTRQESGARRGSSLTQSNLTALTSSQPLVRQLKPLRETVRTWLGDQEIFSQDAEEIDETVDEALDDKGTNLEDGADSITDAFRKRVGEAIKRRKLSSAAEIPKSMETKTITNSRPPDSSASAVSITPGTRGPSQSNITFPG